MDSKKIIEDQVSIYKPQLDLFGDSPKSTLNQEREIQYLRFDRLISQLKLDNEQITIHEIGCGLCDLYKYMLDKELQVKYSGTDIVKKMKSLAKHKYPEVDYFIRDILSTKTNDKYDYVVLSGTFNLPGKVSKNDWSLFTRDMIKKMYEMSERAIVFNFLSKDSEYFNPQMFYESVEDIKEFCLKNLSRHVIIDHSYPLYEFTCTVYKADYIKEKYNETVFKKYLNKS